MDAHHNRRSFFQWSFAALGAFGAAALAAAGVRFVRKDAGAVHMHSTSKGAFEMRGSPSGGGGGLLASKAPDGKYEIAADSVPENSGVIVSAGVTPVVVVRGTETVRVFNATCTHLGCLVKWDPAQQQFHCPCHGGKYDSNGRVIGGPPPYALKEHEVEWKDDVIRMSIA